MGVNMKGFDYSIDNRAFNLTMLFLGLICIYNTINSVILEMHIYIQMIWIVNTLLMLIFYYFGVKQTISSNGKTGIVVYLMFILFPFMWIILGGIEGPALIYLSLILVIFSICFDRSIMVLFIVLFIILLLILIAFQYKMPYIYYEYQSDKERYIEIVIALVTILIYFPMIISRYSREIDNVRYKVLKANEELEIRIKETIEDKNRAEKLYNYFRDKNETLHQISLEDELSGTYNRRYIEKRLKREIEYTNKTHNPLCILMIDLDEFKNINDSYGHQMGDEIIKEVGKTIRTTIEGKGILGRYGGDEFLIIYPRLDLQDAYRLSMEASKKLNKIKIKGISVKFSGGLVKYSGEDANTLISKADDNLYKAKKSGKNIIIKG